MEKIKSRNISQEENLQNRTYLINLDSKGLISHRQKIKEEVTIDTSLRAYFKCCCSTEKVKDSKLSMKLKYELFKVAEEEIKEKSDFINLMKTIDQLRLLRKLILNESQNFMLENREKHFATNKKEGNLDVIKSIREERKKKKEKDLIRYIRAMNNNNTLTDTDRLLMSYLNEDLKDKL